MYCILYLIQGISDNFISFSEANSGYRSIVNYAKLHLKEYLFGILFTLVPS
uniref:Uncharacterized protein n=1 Tax=Echinococcus granulosus TaxID=6210 RepID=A0A068WEQ2_ECHGR|nr:hypothetical protein EgrG_000960200 [Echinococcus granulosus]